MASSGFLVSPKQDPSKEKLWTETWKRIDRFLPDLRGDLALEEPEAEAAPEAEAEAPKTESAAEETTSADKAGEAKEQAGDGADEAKPVKEGEE